MPQKPRIKKGFGLFLRQKSRANDFMQEVAQNTEGISARREKFINGMDTDSYKILPPNKDE